MRLRVIPFSLETFELDWNALESALGPRVRLVAIGAASNALGTITDVARAATLARQAGALSFVDAVHLAAHGGLDAGAIGCDVLACSAYKFYGPHIGVLYGRRERIIELDVPKLRPAPDTAPERLETGTQNHEGIVGAAAAVDFIASLGQGNTRRSRLAQAGRVLHQHGQALVERLWNGLGAISGVRRYGPSPARPRTPTVVFTVDGVPSEQVATRLSEKGVFVSNGDFYAATVIERLGLASEGVVRAGCACYTTPEEVDRLLDGVAAIAHR